MQTSILDWIYGCWLRSIPHEQKKNEKKTSTATAETATASSSPKRVLHVKEALARKEVVRLTGKPVDCATNQSHRFIVPSYYTAWSIWFNVWVICIYFLSEDLGITKLLRMVCRIGTDLQRKDDDDVTIVKIAAPVAVDLSRRRVLLLLLLCNKASPCLLLL